MSRARDDVLARVRGALPGGRSGVPVPREYRRADERPRAALVDLLEERLVDYRAEVRRVGRQHVGEAVVAICRDRSARRIGVPPGLPAEWRPDGIEIVEDRDLTTAELVRLDGVVTGCTAAIAETGTLILAGAPADGRRALTLVPDLHVCVVGEAQILGSVPEGIAVVASAVRADRRPVTLVSGPSATSDIELLRVEGVHGPRQLVVVIAS